MPPPSLVQEAQLQPSKGPPIQNSTSQIVTKSRITTVPVFAKINVSALPKPPAFTKVGAPQNMNEDLAPPPGPEAITAAKENATKNLINSTVRVITLQPAVTTQTSPSNINATATSNKADPIPPPQVQRPINGLSEAMAGPDCNPPDLGLAASKDWIMQFTNLEGAIFQRSASTPTTVFTLTQFLGFHLQMIV
jgi:hypothetical protein